MRRFDPFLAFLLVAFALIAISYAVIVPLFEGPDEDDHFRYTKYLADHRALPVQLFQAGGGEAGHQGWQPPLYYALAALVISPIDTGDYLRRLQRNPAAALTGDRACCGRNLYFHANAEDFPYERTALAVHLARGVTILFGLVAVAAIYALTLTLIPGNHYLALGVTAIATLNPSFLFASSLVSNDIPVVALSTLVLLVMAKLALGVWKFEWQTVGLLGVLVALAIVVKTTALGLVPIALFLLVYLTYTHRPSIRAMAFIFSAFIAPLAFITGWYFTRNLLVYGDPLAYRLIAASALPARDAPLTLNELFLINLPWLWQTFWGGPTPGDLHGVVVWFLFALLLLSIWGTVLYFVRTRHTLGRDRLVMFALMAAWLVFILVAQIQFIRTAAGTDQGRYLFPAISTIAIIFVLGLVELVYRLADRWRSALTYERATRAVALPLTAFALALPLFIAVAYTVPAYTHPTPFDPTQLTNRAAPLDATFENGMSLRGASLSTRALACNDHLDATLYWTGDGRISGTYRVFVHLVGQDGSVAGNKDVIPGNGAYPTVYWEPGEWLEDTVRVPLNRGARSGNYSVIVGVYPFGKPDERQNLDGQDADFVPIGDIQLTAPPNGCP